MWDGTFRHKYGIGGAVLKWFESYLENGKSCSQAVTIGNIISDTFFWSAVSLKAQLWDLWTLWCTPEGRGLYIIICTFKCLSIILVCKISLADSFDWCHYRRIC